MGYKNYRFVINEEAADMAYLQSKLSALTSDARNDLIRRLLLDYFKTSDGLEEDARNQVQGSLEAILKRLEMLEARSKQPNENVAVDGTKIWRRFHLSDEDV